jgi:hypothetical protein
VAPEGPSATPPSDPVAPLVEDQPQPVDEQVQPVPVEPAVEAPAPPVAEQPPAPVSVNPLLEAKPPVHFGKATDVPEPKGPAQRAQVRAPSDDRPEEFDRACADDPHSQSCERFLAPRACSESNPFDEAPFSCDYLLSVNPCRADVSSEGCRQFLETPCFEKPDGPGCLAYLTSNADPQCYPGGPSTTTECQVFIAAQLDACEVAPDSLACSGPFGGSQEQLAFLTDSKGDDQADENAPHPTPQPDPGQAGLEFAALHSQAAGGTDRDSIIPLAGTGSDTGALVVVALLLLGVGLGLRLVVQIGEEVQAPPEEQTTAAPDRPKRAAGPSNRFVMSMVAAWLLLRLLRTVRAAR